MKEGLTVYVFDDEDNAGMIDLAEPKRPAITVQRLDKDGKIVTVEQYKTMADMIQHYKNLKDPDEPEKPDNGCWNCMLFDWKHEACTVNWNNLDESYYNPDTDDRKLTDYCEYHETDPDADPECLDFGGNEP